MRGEAQNSGSCISQNKLRRTSSPRGALGRCLGAIGGQHQRGAFLNARDVKREHSTTAVREALRLRLLNPVARARANKTGARRR